MSEGSNHNLTTEFRRNPDRAMWLVNRVLPAMKQHFEEFDIDVVIGTLTDDNLDAKGIKSNYHRHQKKKNTFQAEGVKRARAAYYFFCNDHRKQLQTDNEDLGFGDVNKKLGEMWNSLNAKDRKPYDKKAETDKARYQTEYGAAKQKAVSSGEFTPNPLDGIKKARTSYLCFSTDPAIRKKYSKKAGDNKELMKILGEVWGGMADDQKKPYQELADEDKERYLKEKTTALKNHKKSEDAKDADAKHEEHPQQSDAEADEDVVSDAADEAGEEVHVPKKNSKKSSSKKPSTKAVANSKPEKKVSSKKTKKTTSVSSEEGAE